MFLNAYCIYDRKALRYHVPFFSAQDGEAVRSFTDLVQDPSTTVGRHPDDYVLYRVGSFDDSNGSLHTANVLQHVIDASACVRHHPVPTADLNAEGWLNGNGRPTSPEVKG